MSAHHTHKISAHKLAISSSMYFKNQRLGTPSNKISSTKRVNMALDFVSFESSLKTSVMTTSLICKKPRER
jgi:hypothetical protein